MTKIFNTYATDGKCHNSNVGTFNHECGKPATWLGTKDCASWPGGTFTSGYCDRCKESGDEARTVKTWQRVETHTIPEGRRNYWGQPDRVKQVAPGVLWITTPSHGGIVLSNERNAQMPEDMRRDDAAYEEDCNWALPILAFDLAAALAAIESIPGQTGETIVMQAIKTIQHWHPKVYARLYPAPSQDPQQQPAETPATTPQLI